MEISRNKLRLKRKKRVSAKIKSDSQRLRFSVFRSLKNLTVQVIDDENKKTLVFAGLKEIKAKNDLTGAMLLGQLVAKKCLEKKITEVIFDRSGYKYHGKIKAIAEGAREKGLKF